MLRVNGLMSRFVRDRRGTTSIEYGLIAAPGGGRACWRAESARRRQQQQLGQYLHQESPAP